MTDRERRVLAAMDAVGWRGAPTTVYRTVEVMLDAADRAVPMVPKRELTDQAQADRAEAAERELASLRAALDQLARGALPDVDGER